MKSPKMIVYIDEPGLAGLLNQVDGGAIIERNKGIAHERGDTIQAGAEAGGGFLSLLGLAKLSLIGSKNNKQMKSDGEKVSVGAHAHLGLIISRLKEAKGSIYFESLDEAYGKAPEEESSWVCIKDRFALTNLGHDLSFDALNHEKRFLFEIIPPAGGYSEQDAYYKAPRRVWRLSMAASFERCPRLQGRHFGISSHEGMYFRRYGFSSIPLNVFGCYMRVGLCAQIIPYAIWI